ncbi:MAG: GTPase Era [Alphaproteobacteria bacterium]|nr:MAG: GTPase Era [Alphaproteobacteria bacterium]TAF40795.1 MAG: GTPase Era [Alphaproteobacteria bacterium]TAF76642.1 MAG: GTPase Era [Alphaproteobacteria bacterium]
MVARCGFVAVVGAPNAGKSTLVNALVKARVAIVTPKVQTTRSRILGIVTEAETQLILIDTPGIFQAKARFEQAMVNSALGSTKESDKVMVVIDAYRGMCDDSKHVLDSVRDAGAPCLLVLNKIDKVAKERLLELAGHICAHYPVERCFMIAARTRDGVDDVRQYLAQNLPEGPWHYPEDMMTDVPLRQWAAEVTRESLFYRLQQELPYSIAVETEQWNERKDGSVEIRQVIYVQNDNQKKIVVGHKGEMLKEVGQAARTRMIRFMERKVHLFLFVKVTEGWKEQKSFYSSIGLNY